MTPPDVGAIETGSISELADQPFGTSAMGDSMDSDLLPELSGETWVAAQPASQYWSNIGGNDRPTLAPNIGTMQFAHWPNIGPLHWRNVCPIWEAKHGPM